MHLLTEVISPILSEFDSEASSDAVNFERYIPDFDAQCNERVRELRKGALGLFKEDDFWVKI